MQKDPPKISRWIHRTYGHKAFPLLALAREHGYGCEGRSKAVIRDVLAQGLVPVSPESLPRLSSINTFAWEPHTECIIYGETSRQM